MFELMANNLPPPHEIPQASEAPPPQLQTFLYLMMRDLLPTGYVAAIMREAYMTRDSTAYSNQHLADYAEEIARQLTYTETSDTP